MNKAVNSTDRGWAMGGIRVRDGASLPHSFCLRWVK